MEYTKKFKELSKKDAYIAGGKGASLGEMLNSGIPVPDGYVVTAETFDHFLSETDLVQEIQSILDTVNVKAIHTSEDASEKIQGLIKSVKMPEDIKSEILSQFKELNADFVAVRSSATAEDGAEHAWAGQLNSYLNTREENLLEMVQNCWASLFTPRAIFYRFEKGLHATHISVAVVVQKMVDSEKSGIAFSVHPVTEDHNQLIIEAGLGLGEAIVSGSVTPDSYVVTKEPKEVIDINVNTQNKALYRGTEKTEHGFNEWKDLSESQANEQVLNKDQILELSTIIETIENHYGFPCDIEWAFEGGKFYIVQSRPITTLKAKNNNPKQLFEKTYTRDTSLIIQQGWFEVLHSGIEKLDIKREFDTPVVHFMNRGSIEIWENETYTKWFLDKLLEKNTNNPDLVKGIIKKFEEELLYFNSCWKKGPISNVRELKSYIEKVFSFLVGFITFYYSAYDERTPIDIRNWALEIRDKDSFFASNDRLIRDSLKEIYPNLVGYESCILFDEIENPPSLETLKKRRESFVVVGRVYSNIENILDYSKNKEDFNFHFEKPEENPDDIKGQTGFKGVIRGKVKLLLRNDQVSEVQEGDILVSPMTTPEHVIAMEKASAFITDEGGITCHAAIVAREMQKPCIIGTKFATQILKDGDEVEVDADNGVVRILEKKKEEMVFNGLNLLDKNNWVEDGRWIQPPLIWGMFTHWSESDLVKNITENIDLGTIFTIDGYAFHEKKTFDNISNFIKKKYDEDGLGKLSEFIDNEGEKIFKKINDYLDKQDSEIISDFNNFFEEYLSFVGFWTAVTLLGNSITEVSKDRGYVSTEADLFALVHPHLKNSWIEEDAHDIKDIAKKCFDKFKSKNFRLIKEGLLKDEEIKADINKYIKKYEWSKISKWKGSKLTEQQVIERLEEEFNNLINKNHIESEKSFSKPDGLVSLCVSSAFYRAQSTMLEMKTAYRLNSLFKIVGDKNNLEYEDILLLTPFELKEVFNKLDLVIDNTRNLESRKSSFMCVIDKPNHEKIITSDDQIYKKIYNTYIENKSINNNDDLRGIGASKGKVIANVRIINSADDFGSFKEGEVLVTVETSPTFVPLMRMSSAILTGRGGITSHAAIVSRELSKPCIIAIKNVVKILKTGDLVEVDADNGVVKIL